MAGAAPLLQQPLSTYVVLFPRCVQAVAADTDYYGRAPQLFTELTSVRWGGLGRVRQVRPHA